MTFLSKNTRNVPLHTLEREILVAGILWIMFGAVCVVAANAWAMSS